MQLAALAAARAGKICSRGPTSGGTPARASGTGTSAPAASSQSSAWRLWRTRSCARQRCPLPHTAAQEEGPPTPLASQSSPSGPHTPRPARGKACRCTPQSCVDIWAVRSMSRCNTSPAGCSISSPPVPIHSHGRRVVAQQPCMGDWFVLPWHGCLSSSGCVCQRHSLVARDDADEGLRGDTAQVGRASPRSPAPAVPRTQGLAFVLVLSTPQVR